MSESLKNFKNGIKKVLPFNIWDYTPESIRRVYIGKPLLISREIRALKEKLLSDKASWNDLVSYAKIADYDSNHSFYESMLKAYDPSLDFKNIKGINYVGSGYGIASLNCYRRVDLQIKNKSVHCFEKVYIRNSMDFKKMKWFYDSIAPQVKDKVRVPALLNVNGVRLGVTYFEWIESNQCAEDEIVTRFLEVVSHLKHIEVDVGLKKTSPVTCYSDDLLFNIYFERAKNWLRENFDVEQTAVLEKIHRLILKDKSIERRFVHGNISRSNLLSPNILIDFDSCGYYPFEYEVSSFLTSTFTFETLELFYERFHAIEESCRIKLNERVLLYFTFIFNMRFKKSEGEGFIRLRDRFLHELWRHITLKLIS